MATITSTYFNGRMTAQTMKDLYRKLVRQYHPDLNHGIDDSTIKTINNEYSYWYARAAAQEVYTTKSQENPDRDYSHYTSAVYIDNLTDMINWILNENIDRNMGITVELIGVFIWIGGINATDDHKLIREKIKAQGFNGGWKITANDDRVYMWKWTPNLKRFRSDPNIDSIRNRYGSTRYDRGQNRLA